MYKVSVLDLFFDYFSHYRFVFDRHSQIICSRWQSFDVDFVCIKESHNDFTDVIYHFYLFYLFAERNFTACRIRIECDFCQFRNIRSWTVNHKIQSNSTVATIYSLKILNVSTGFTFVKTELCIGFPWVYCRIDCSVKNWINTNC